MFALFGIFLQGKFILVAKGADMFSVFSKEPRAGLGKDAISLANIIFPQAHWPSEIGS